MNTDLTKPAKRRMTFILEMTEDGAKGLNWPMLGEISPGVEIIGWSHGDLLDPEAKK